MRHATRISRGDWPSGGQVPGTRRTASGGCLLFDLPFWMFVESIAVLTWRRAPVSSIRPALAISGGGCFS
jgi:hypothetical protein